MPAFHFIAINQKGEKQKGTLEADSEKQARQLIRAKSLMPLELKPITHSKSSAASAPKASRKQSMNSKELALMTRQFATLLAAGLPVEEVLAAVAEQTEKSRTKGLILAVRSQVMGGHSLASAMREFPYAFSSLYCSTVAAGEKSGHLDLVLQRLADYTEQQFQMKQRIQHALIYPSLMVLVSISIVIFLLEYVVPKMITVYSSLGKDLPILTRVLIGISNEISQFGLYFLIGLIVFIFLFSRAVKNNFQFRKKFHAFLLKIPILGNAIKMTNTARFARTFAILSSAGVSVLEAMSVSSALITNIPIRESVDSATSKVREGANINLALKQTGYFPPMSIHLIASGEASGQLENMLERAAANQDNEISQLIQTSLALFEPAIILLMGAIVLFIVLAVLLPIFELNQFT